MDWLRHRFELSRGAGNNLLAMEGLRGFAVFLVFLVHYVAFVKPWLPPESFSIALGGKLHAVGNTGVDLFFVLSGYLIYGSLISREQPFLKFMARRVQRIYPAFAAVFAIYVALAFSPQAPAKVPPGAWAGSVYLLENFLLLPGIFPITALITVAWSLSYEMFFYLLTPVAIGALGLRKWPPPARVALFLAAAIGWVACYGWVGERVRLVMFIAGMVLHECLSAKLVRMPGSATAFLFLAAGLGLMVVPSSLVGGFAGQVSGLFVSFFVLCLVCFGRMNATAAAVFSWTPLRWLGNMSYSYYLLHGLTLRFAFVALARLWPPNANSPAVFFALLPVMFVVSLLPPAGLFLLVERPFSLEPKHRANGTR